MTSNNPLKDVTLQSSKFSFNADAKNKIIDLEFSRELKILERRLGMSTYSINREMRSLKAEIKTIQKSTGHCGEGLPSEDDKLLQDGIYWELSSKSVANSLNARPHGPGKHNGRGQHKKSTDKADVLADNGRKYSALNSAVNERNRMTLNARSDNLLVRRRTKSAEIQSSNHNMKTASKMTRTNKNALNRLSVPVDFRPHSVEIGTGITKKHKKMVIKSKDDVQRPYSANDVFINGRRPSVTDDLGIVHNVCEDEDGSVADCEKQIEDDEVNLVAKHNSNPRRVWLKSALKDRQQISNGTAKKVTISTSDNDHNDGQKYKPQIGSSFQNMNSGHDLSHHNNTPTNGNLLAMFIANFQQNQSELSPNKIPDVRKSVQSKQSLIMKKRRDSLLTASVSRLITKTSNGKSHEINKNGNQQNSEEQPSKRPNGRRGSLRFRNFVTNNLMPAEQKSTLGSRLIMKSVAETSSAMSISKSVKIYNSDSEDEDKPLTPRIAPKNVKSKIASKWRNAKSSDKPPDLQRDKEQLKMHLVASRTSRERDLERIQGENVKDPKKDIDAERQVGVMTKIQAFNAFLENKKKEEERHDKAVKIIRELVFDKYIKKRRTPVSPALQKWRQIARRAIGKE